MASALNTHALHQPGNRAAGDVKTFPLQLPPDLPHAIDPPVLFENTQDLGPQCLVTPGTVRQSGRISPLRQVLIIRGRGNRQDSAERLDPMLTAMHVDKGHHHFDRRSSSAIAKYADALRRISFA